MTTDNEAREAQPATPKVEYEAQGERPGRTLTQRTAGEITLLMSEIDDGVFVGWDHCNACGAHVRACQCTGGPQEKEFVTRWRQERIAKLAPRASAPTVEPKLEPEPEPAVDSDTRQNLDAGLDDAKAALAARAAEIQVEF